MLKDAIMMRADPEGGDMASISKDNVIGFDNIVEPEIAPNTELVNELQKEVSHLRISGRYRIK